MQATLLNYKKSKMASSAQKATFTSCIQQYTHVTTSCPVTDISAEFTTTGNKARNINQRVFYSH